MPTRMVVNNSSAQYHRLTKSSDDGFIDLQFVRPPPKVPWKAISLAVVLFVVGSILLTIGALLLSGTLIDQKYADRTWPVLILGLLMFIPGSYHVRLAFYAYQGYQGYSYSDIPDFGD
ncbi:transmembrane protein 230 [Lingula anatina]|uniref:Transmembrane protein 230 n=1 Tax=Lingula anatina TaxID=7574 RepID=A0A1S3H695_LINAN|nr:transmembrane protein 230 [Lingula anatina]XP_013381001.1 transmembrane protein 230 [Lingula anatina]|eukprot:XP_013381000.1 transmembrane protein 230 [Lingula anatina]